MSSSSIGVNGVQFADGTNAVSGVYNVKDPAYGAKGDGVTDDTSAIAAAITAANGNADVEFPAGTYIVKNLSVSIANTRLRGTMGAVLKLPALASLNGSPIINVTANGFSARFLAFDGNKSAQPADGFSDSFNGGANSTGRAYRAAIKAYNSGGEIVGLTVEDCSFKNTYGAGLAAQNCSQVSFQRNKSQDLNFELAILYSNYSAGSFLRDIRVIGNYINHSASGDGSVNANGIIVRRGKNVVIANNVAYNLERNLVKCEYCSGVSVTGNVLDTNTIDNFSGIQFQDEAQDIVVSGNKLANTGGGIFFNSISSTVAFSNILISGNVISGTTGSTTADGVSITPGFSATGISVVGNEMTGIARYGVYMNIGVTTNDVNISNNRITTTGTVNGGGVVLSPSVSGSNYVICNNQIDLGNINVNASGIKFFASGGALANVLVGGNEIITGSGHTAINEAAGAISSGSIFVNHTDGTISAADLTTTFSNDVTASGALTVTGTTTTNGALTCNGNVTLGTAIQGNPAFAVGTHTLLTSQSGADTAGSTLAITAGQGGTASATGGGTGGALNVSGANGGAGTASLNPGGGGNIVAAGGNGGSGGTGNSSGGHFVARGGTAQGTGTKGSVILGDANTADIRIGSGGSVPVNAGRGTITQTSSITSTVVVNTPSGVITTVSATTAAQATATFTVTNAAVLSSSVVVVSLGAYSGTFGTNGTPLVSVSTVAAGSFNITIYNAHATAALNGTLKINYVAM